MITAQDGSNKWQINACYVGNKVPKFAEYIHTVA
jgi:hypothetical protein